MTRLAEGTYDSYPKTNGGYGDKIGTLMVTNGGDDADWKGTGGDERDFEYDYSYAHYHHPTDTEENIQLILYFGPLRDIEGKLYYKWRSWQVDKPDDPWPVKPEEGRIVLQD
ncbi:MAG: hypothetical protein GY937_20060 [bacterium]|nr:hypothetical protein [bacterium]